MPFGRSYRKKAKRAFKKYGNKRVLKKMGKKVVGKFIPGYNVYSTADDVLWAGEKAYRFLKRKQMREINRSTKDRSPSRKKSKGRRKRYGIDDYY